MLKQPNKNNYEAPEVFDYDPTTNRLSLKPGQPPPWLRQNVGQGDPNVWLYCEDCFTQHVGPGDRRRSAGGVPFRDKAMHDPACCQTVLLCHPAIYGGRSCHATV